MRANTIVSILLILIATACVDILQFDIVKSSDYGIVIDGFISDQPGPYTVKISKAFDIESKESIKIPIKIKHLIISDNVGTSEELAEVRSGVYETNAKGIRGLIGRVYKLKVELLDGKIYESLPDTIMPTGKLDSLYYSFNGVSNSDGSTSFGFDIFANSSRGNNFNSRFMWNMIGTFKSDTHPEQIPKDRSQCYPIGSGNCNYLPFCTGLRNKALNSFSLPIYERIAPCECCTCWYKLFNESPILSDEYFSAAQTFTGMKIYRVPINYWIFMYKIHVEIRILSLSNNTFRFFKAIRDQKNAVNSLFQPVSGKIPINFIQLNGEETPIQGLFYAIATSNKSLYITRNDLPDLNIIPSIEAGPGSQAIDAISCLDLFPNSSTIKPAFWID